MDEFVPKVGDRFTFRYRRVRTTFEVINKTEDGRWLCRAMDRRFKGLEAKFEQEQVLMLVGVFLHTGAVVV